MAARPLSQNWPLAGEAATTRSDTQTDEEAISDSSSVFEQDSENNAVVGTTELYENGQIRLIPVSVRKCRASTLADR